MGRMRVDVAGHDIRLDLVAPNVGGGTRVIDRIEHVKKFHRLVAALERRQRHHEPGGGVLSLVWIIADALVVYVFYTDAGIKAEFEKPK